MQEDKKIISDTILSVGSPFPAKPYLCEIHGERYGDMVFTDQDGNVITIFCSECVRLKLLECGLKPMQRIEHSVTLSAAKGKTMNDPKVKGN